MDGGLQLGPIAGNAAIRKREVGVEHAATDEPASMSALDAEHEMLKRVENHLQKRLKSLESEDVVYRARLQKIKGGAGAPVVYGSTPHVSMADPLVWRRGSEAAQRLAQSSSLSDSDEDEENGGSSSMPRDLTAPTEHGTAGDEMGDGFSGEDDGELAGDGRGNEDDEGGEEDDDDDDDEDEAERQQLAQLAASARAHLQQQGPGDSLPPSGSCPPTDVPPAWGGRAQARADAPALASPVADDDEFAEHDARGHARPLGGGKRRMPKPKGEHDDDADDAPAKGVGRQKSSGGCPACNGRHRAHTCGKGKPRKNEREAAAALAGLLGWGGLEQ